MEFTRKELRKLFEKVISNASDDQREPFVSRLMESINTELDVLFPIYKKGEEPTKIEKLVGTLSREQKFRNNGGVANQGDPVYDVGDRYRIYFAKIVNEKEIKFPVEYYKETFKSILCLPK